MQAYEKWDTNEHKIEIWKMKFLFIFWLGVFILVENRCRRQRIPGEKTTKKFHIKEIKKKWKKKLKKKR